MLGIAQTDEKIKAADTIYISYRAENNLFFVRKETNTSFYQPCNHYGIQYGYNSNYIKFNSCRFKGDPILDRKEIKRRKLKKELVLTATFLKEWGFKKVIKHFYFKGKTFYVFKESKKRKIMIEEVEFFTNYYPTEDYQIEYIEVEK